MEANLHELGERVIALETTTAMLLTRVTRVERVLLEAQAEARIAYRSLEKKVDRMLELMERRDRARVRRIK